MTEEVKGLAQYFLGLYKLVRIQQEILAKVVAGEKDLKASQTLRAAIPMIDLAIDSLQRDYGPWEN